MVKETDRRVRAVCRSLNTENIEETFNVHWGKKNDAKLKLKLSRRLPDDDSPFFYRIDVKYFKELSH